MDKVPQSSFTLNIDVLKMMGLYPSNSYKYLNETYSQAFLIISMFPVAVLCILYFVVDNNFTNITYNDFVTVSMPFYTLKFLPFVMRRAEIKNCIHYFDEVCLDEPTEQHREISNDFSHVCQRNTKVYFWGCQFSAVTVVIRALADTEQLPFHAWVPEMARESQLYYYIEYASIVLGLAYATTACGVMDPLIGGLAYQATAQLKILKLNLQYIDNEIEKHGQRNAGSPNVYMEIRKSVQHYQKITIFIQKYEHCFSPVVFSQLTGSGLVLGLLCYKLSKLPTDDMAFYLTLSYLIVLCCQIFFYCYYGTLLIEESKNLPSAMYMINWYEYTMQCQKALNIFMEQSQKPMVVTAGKLFELSLDTFMLILKRAYSLMAVLRNY